MNENSDHNNENREERHVIRNEADLIRGLSSVALEKINWSWRDIAFADWFIGSHRQN